MDKLPTFLKVVSGPRSLLLVSNRSHHCLISVGRPLARHSCAYSPGGFSPCRQRAVSEWKSLPCSLRRQSRVRASSDQESEEKPVQYSTKFGYSRKDVFLIGFGLLALGVGLYNGLQAFGMEAGQAGNVVQAGIFLLLALGWTASYLVRVVNKDMTYGKQLEQYEEAVMQKRLEEMPETERERLFEEVEKEKLRRANR